MKRFTIQSTSLTSSLLAYIASYITRYLNILIIVESIDRQLFILYQPEQVILRTVSAQTKVLLYSLIQTYQSNKERQKVWQVYYKWSLEIGLYIVVSTILSIVCYSKVSLYIRHSLGTSIVYIKKIRIYYQQQYTLARSAQF